MSTNALKLGDKIIVPADYDDWSQSHRLVRRNEGFYPMFAGQVATVDEYFPQWQWWLQDMEGGFYQVLTSNWSLMIPQDMAESAVKITEGEGI